MTTTVGFIGLGVMGDLMARRLVVHGTQLIVYTRTSEKALRFAEETGALTAQTPAQVAEVSQIVITMLANQQAVDDIYGGPDGLIAGLRSDAM